MNTLKEMIDEMVASLDDETQEVQELARTVATDAAQVTARAIRGEEVDKEVAHLEAQAVNLTAGAKEAVYNVVADFVGNVLNRFIPV